jgi:sec-independent protein translocase protein TatC
VAKLKPVSHEDRLTIVEHLDELRSRLIVCALALAAAFALCFWQDELILDIASDPLRGTACGGPDEPGCQPTTLSPTEPFLTTVTLSLYGAILLTLPIILYQLYAFVLPAFSPTERRVAMPLLLLVPFLFIGGVLFCYYIVVPPALDFLLSFNAEEFNTEVRARDYYGFVALSLLALGLLFQIPVGILAATRLGITTPQKLRKNRRYAVLVIAILAALLPTIDPVTLIIEMIPLIALYELSILLAVAFGRPPGEVADKVASAEGSAHS